MKFCLSSRQTPEYLKLANEIKIQGRDINQTYDLIDQYPKATFVYNYSEKEEKMQNKIKELSFLAKGRLTVCVFYKDDIEFCKENDIPFFLAYPAQTLETARTVKALGVSQIIPDNQLAHQLPELKLLNVPVRYFPTSTFLDGLSREDGVVGNWIRPEDLPYYSIFIDTVDFGTQPQKREQALYRIYAQQKSWQGELGKLVTDLNYIGENPYIPATVGKARINCGLRCQSSRHCNICYTGLAVSATLGSQTLEQVMSYKEKLQNESENINE